MSKSHTSTSKSRSRSKERNGILDDFDRTERRILKWLRSMRDHVQDNTAAIRNAGQQERVRQKYREAMSIDMKRISELKVVLMGTNDDRAIFKQISSGGRRSDERSERNRVNCPECNLSLQKKGFWHHLHKAHNLKQYFKCPQCPFQNSTALKVATHIKTHQGGVENDMKNRLEFQCPYTDKIFSSVPHLATHISVCENYSVIEKTQGASRSKSSFFGDNKEINLSKIRGFIKEGNKDSQIYQTPELSAPEIIGEKTERLNQ